MIATQANTKGAVILDDRYSPLIVSTFIGDVELALGKWFEQALVQLVTRESARGRRIVNISDATRTTRTTAEMRKFWAAMSARQEEYFTPRVLASPIVVTNPLFRGVITAVGWLNPAVAKIELYPSLEACIQASLVELERAGTAVTLPQGGYRLPVEASLAALQGFAKGA